MKELNETFLQAKKRKNKQYNELTYRGKSETDNFVNTYNMWKTNNIEEQKLYESVKKSHLFDEKRVKTFIKFNYRNAETKNINYITAFQKILAHREIQNGQKKFFKGTMRISELWGQKSLSQIMGNLPFPKDRLKVLDSYQTNRHKIRSRKIRRVATEESNKQNGAFIEISQQFKQKYRSAFQRKSEC